MKHLKHFEDLGGLLKYPVKPSTGPQVDDYVLCSSEENNKNVKKFVENNVGKIIKHEYKNATQYKVQYENIPNEIIGFFTDKTKARYFHPDSVLYWSKNKSDIEAQIAGKDFGL